MTANLEAGAEVLAVARALRLTVQQQRFAEALAADPERNQTRAARAAGSKQPALMGSKWITRLRQRLGPLSVVAGFQVSISGRF
jgi:hypothetical protein